MMVESEDGVAYRRDSSFIKPYHPLTDGKRTADIALENEELETQIKKKKKKKKTRDARPSRTIRLPERLKDFVMDKSK